MKLLLLDDDEFLCDMYAQKFQEVGHSLQAFTSGEDALETLENDPEITVVLLDMIMPNMDGLTFLKKAQAQEKGKDRVYIVLSNQGEEKDRTAALEAGAKGYIVKAESIPSDVVAKVEELVNEA